MSKIKFKIITGFREDQSYTIEADEAHKAYYLFNNPEKRGVFENGVALVGKNIQGIEPDWNAIMGFNPDYQLDYDDWNTLRRTGLENRARNALIIAKNVSEMIDSKPELLKLKLSDIKNNLQLGQETSQFKEELNQLTDKLSLK